MSIFVYTGSPKTVVLVRVCNQHFQFFFGWSLTSSIYYIYIYAIDYAHLYIYIYTIHPYVHYLFIIKFRYPIIPLYNSDFFKKKNI